MSVFLYAFREREFILDILHYFDHEIWIGIPFLYDLIYFFHIKLLFLNKIVFA